MTDFIGSAYMASKILGVSCFIVLATRALVRWSDTEHLMNKLVEVYVEHKKEMREKYSKKARILVLAISVSAVGASSVSAANTFTPSLATTEATYSTALPSEGIDRSSSFPSIRAFSFLSQYNPLYDFAGCIDRAQLEPCSVGDFFAMWYECGSCVAAVIAAVASWKALNGLLVAMKVGRIVANISRLSIVWTAVAQAADWVLARCQGCGQNDCVWQVVRWARNLVATGCVLERVRHE